MEGVEDSIKSARHSETQGSWGGLKYSLGQGLLNLFLNCIDDQVVTCQLVKTPSM